MRCQTLILAAVMLLLASVGVLKGQKVVTKDINYSNAVFESKITNVLAVFPKQPVAYRNKADAVKQISDALCKYLNNLKERITNESGGTDENGELRHMENISACTNVMVQRKAGDTLKKKIIELRKCMLKQVSNADSLGKTINLRIEANKYSGHTHQNWAEENFNQIPVIAAIALLTKYQNDVRSSELIILNRILEESKAAIK